MTEPSKKPGGVALGVIGSSGYQSAWHREFLPEEGVYAAQLYQRIRDEDPIVGGVFLALESMFRQVEWKEVPADDSTEAQTWATFLQECRADMSHTFPAFIAEALSMLVHGWAYFEVVYKIRRGPEQNDPAHRSFVAGNAALAGVEASGRSDCGSAIAAETKPPATPPVAETKPPLAQTPPAKPPGTPTRPPAEPTQRPVVQAPPAESPKPVANSAGDMLRPAIDAYLAGRYAEVLRLTAKQDANARIGWHQQTLRAASAWQLSQLDGAASDSATTARNAATAARKLDPARRPDAAFYPPRFLTFFSGS